MEYFQFESYNTFIGFGLDSPYLFEIEISSWELNDWHGTTVCDNADLKWNK